MTSGPLNLRFWLVCAHSVKRQPPTTLQHGVVHTTESVDLLKGELVDAVPLALASLQSKPNSYKVHAVCVKAVLGFFGIMGKKARVHVERQAVFFLTGSAVESA